MKDEGLRIMHKSVLLQEVIAGLDLKEGETFLDGTINRGGHSEAVAKIFGRKIKIIGLDLDERALAKAEERLERAGADFILKNESFRNLDKVFQDSGLLRVNKILFDLGWSTDQMETSGRGFSFQRDEPLLMTFKDTPAESDLTAADILNFWDEENIVTILESYGEEKFARQIARAAVFRRKERPIKTTFDLVALVKEATPKGYQRGRINPATKTFQALRIAVNDEIGALKEALAKGFSHLRVRGRLLVISFHSLEDKLVKNFAKENERAGWARIITKKPIVPQRAEILANPRCRSAKLRIIERL